jgi:hypothetical protein
VNIRIAPIGDFVEPVRTWNPATKPDATLTYVDLSAVDQDEKQIKAAVQVRGVEAPSRARQLISKGDILVSTVRPNLNGVAAVTDEFDGATASTGFCVLRPRTEKLSSNYLMHWVRSPQFVKLMVREATGASYPAVSDRIIKASRAFRFPHSTNSGGLRRSWTRRMRCAANPNAPLTCWTTSLRQSFLRFLVTRSATRRVCLL